MSNTVTYKNIIITEYFKLILNIKVLKSKWQEIQNKGYNVKFVKVHTIKTIYFLIIMNNMTNLFYIVKIINKQLITYY